MSENIHWKKNIAWFLGGQSVSLFGSSIIQYALLWHVTLSTQSGWMMTLYIFFGFVPTLLLSPYAGVWADRYPRKKLIMWSDSIIALATLGMAIVFQLGYDSMVFLLMVAAVRACGTAVQTPTVFAMIPQMVPKDHLTRVNGWQSSLQSLNFFVAPVASGALLSWLPLGQLLLIDVLTAMIGVGILGGLVNVPVQPREDSDDPDKKGGWSTDMLAGFRYIRNHPFIYSFFVYLSLLLFFVAAPMFLSPLQVARSFGPEVWRLTAIELTFSVGMFLGSVLVSWWGGFANRMHTMILAVTVFGLFIVAMGLTTIFWLYLAWMVILGVVLPMFNTAIQVSLQEKVEEQMMGRVFSVHTMINSSMMPLGMLVFGPLADVVTIETVMVVTGVLVLIQAMVMASHRSFLRESGA